MVQHHPHDSGTVGVNPWPGDRVSSNALRAATTTLMNRGHNREVVFQTDDDHLYFLGLLARYRERFAVRRA